MHFDIKIILCSEEVIIKDYCSCIYVEFCTVTSKKYEKRMLNHQCLPCVLHCLGPGFSCCLYQCPFVTNPVGGSV